jgi:hypothetical protein
MCGCALSSIREGPEKRRLALAKGLQKLKRAAYHASKARAPASRPLAVGLLRIAERIERDGLNAQLADDLRSMVGAAIAIEAETGEPVAHSHNRRDNRRAHIVPRAPTGISED